MTEAETLARDLSTAGLQLTRTDVFRQAIALGFDKLRAKAKKRAK